MAPFRYAAENGLILLTKNPDDFLELHAKDSQQAGILLVYQDSDPDRDMSHAEIVRALANLEKAGVAFVGSCHVLNAWTRVSDGTFHDFHYSWVLEIKRASKRGLIPKGYYVMAEQIGSS